MCSTADLEPIRHPGMPGRALRSGACRPGPRISPAVLPFQRRKILCPIPFTARCLAPASTCSGDRVRFLAGRQPRIPRPPRQSRSRCGVSGSKWAKSKPFWPTIEAVADTVVLAREARLPGDRRLGGLPGSLQVILPAWSPASSKPTCAPWLEEPACLRLYGAERLSRFCRPCSAHPCRAAARSTAPRSWPSCRSATCHANQDDAHLREAPRDPIEEVVV